MSTDPTGTPADPGAGPAGAGAQPSEEELRAAYEAELSRITAADMMLQAAVSLLNIGSFRLAPASPGSPAAADASAPGAQGPDLDQARDAIDGVKALLEILERRLAPAELAPLRNALSQLQMAYAREMQATGAGPPAGEAAPAGGDAAGTASGGAEPAPGGQQGGEQRPPEPGPAESSGRLWVPGR